MKRIALIAALALSMPVLAEDPSQTNVLPKNTVSQPAIPVQHQQRNPDAKAKRLEEQQRKLNEERKKLEQNPAPKTAEEKQAQEKAQQKIQSQQKRIDQEKELTQGKKAEDRAISQDTGSKTGITAGDARHGGLAKEQQHESDRTHKQKSEHVDAHEDQNTGDQGKHSDGRHDRGKHKGWEKKGKHKGTENKQDD